MWIELSSQCVIIFNFIGIPAVHLLISFWSTTILSNNFSPDQFLYRPKHWEANGRIYRKVFLLPRWKEYLPDAAPWFKGAPKKKLDSKDLDYLRNFVVETCRGEFSHWLQMIVLFGFVIWNPFPANLVIIIYSVFSNLPCILNLRYTRVRLLRVIGKKESLA